MIGPQLTCVEQIVLKSEAELVQVSRLVPNIRTSLTWVYLTFSRCSCVRDAKIWGTSLETCTSKVQRMSPTFLGCLWLICQVIILFIFINSW